MKPPEMSDCLKADPEELAGVYEMFGSRNTAWEVTTCDVCGKQYEDHDFVEAGNLDICQECSVEVFEHWEDVDNVPHSELIRRISEVRVGNGLEPLAVEAVPG